MEEFLPGEKIKKTFLIERIGESKMTPFIKIDFEDFYNFGRVISKFNLSRTKILHQLQKCQYGFVDGDGNPHKVDWIIDEFSEILKIQKFNKRNEKNIKKCQQKLKDLPRKNGKLF